MSRKIWAAEQSILCERYIIELDNLFLAQIAELKKINNVSREHMSKEEFEKLKSISDKYMESRERPKKILKMYRNFVVRAARSYSKPVEGGLSV